MWKNLKVWFHQRQIDALHSEIGFLKHKIAELEFDVKMHRKSIDKISGYSGYPSSEKHPTLDDMKKYVVGIDPIK